MFYLAAAAAAKGDHEPNVFESVAAIFSRPDTLAHPESLMESLETMAMGWSIAFVILGLICLFQGYRFYRPVTVTLAVAIGAFAGYAIGETIDAPYIVAGCLAALLGVGCYREMKYAVPVMGGLAGAFVGANLWSSLHLVAGVHTVAAQQYWIGALIGLIMGGMLAFILFKVSVEMFTSVCGATLAVLGSVALLLRIETFSPTVWDSLAAHSVILPLMVLVPTLIGFILQESQNDAPMGGKGDPKPAT